MWWDCDFFALAVTLRPLVSKLTLVGRKKKKKKNALVVPRVFTLHLAPMSPFEDHHRRSAVHFQHLPGERGHHSLERLVALFKVVLRGIIVLVRRQEGVVRAYAQHVFARLCRPAVEVKGIRLLVDRPPVLQGGLV